MICMYWPLEMLWEWIPMNMFMCQYSEYSILLILFYCPDWADMTHQQPELELLSLFMMQYILCMIFLLSYPIYMFIPNISICIIVILGLCYMYQSALLILVTSHNLLLYVKFTLSFSTYMFVLSMPVLCKLNHTLYFYLQFVRCIFSI